MRCRRNCLGVELGEDRVLVDDVIELAFERLQLGIGQAKASEVGDMLDIGAGKGGHDPIIAEAMRAFCQPDGVIAVTTNRERQAYMSIRLS